MSYPGKKGNLARPGARVWIVLALSIAAAAAGSRAYGQREPSLTPAQVDNLRDAAQLPNERLKLYVKYIGERVAAIHQIAGNTLDRNRGAELHHMFGEFSGLTDELDDNLDSYDQQKADMRKGLELVVKESERWKAIMTAPPPSSQYDFARSLALDSLKGLHEDAVQMLQEQNVLFAKKKKQKHH